jgi:hypothetical protein
MAKKKKKKTGITTRRASNQCKTSDRGLLGDVDTGGKFSSK